VIDPVSCDVTRELFKPLLELEVPWALCSQTSIDRVVTNDPTAIQGQPRWRDHAADFRTDDQS